MDSTPYFSAGPTQAVKLWKKRDRLFFIAML